MWPDFSSAANGRATMPVFVKAALGKPDVEMYPELFEVGAAIGQLLIQHMPVNVPPVLAQQILAGEDKAVEPGLEVFGAFHMRWHAGQHRFYGMHVAVAVSQLHLFRHLAHIAALIGVGGKGTISSNSSR